MLTWLLSAELTLCLISSLAFVLLRFVAAPEPLAVFLRSVGRLTQPSALMAPHPDSITLSPLTLQQPEEPRPLSPQARAFQQPDQQQALPPKPRSYDIVRTFQSVEEMFVFFLPPPAIPQANRQMANDFLW
jgi:hypothetical protein